MKHYEVMAGADLPEDLKVTVIIDSCTKDLKEHLELSTCEMTYKQVRDEIISYAQRKRNAFSNDLIAMGVEEMKDDLVLARAATRAGPRAVPRARGSTGGFNGDYKGIGKGDFSTGGSKGDGQGQGGKGSGLNGHCHWCGEWGPLSIALSPEGRLHGEPAKEREGQPQWRLRAHYKQRRRQQEPVGTLASVPWSTVFRRTGSWHCENSTWNGQMANDPVDPPGLTLGDFIQVKPRFHKKTKSKKMNQWARVSDLNNVEINTVHEKGDPNELTITIDSGASENAISEEFAPQVRVWVPQGSWEESAASRRNGGTMSNRGEKYVHVLTTEGR